MSDHQRTPHSNRGERGRESGPHVEAGLLSTGRLNMKVEKYRVLSTRTALNYPN